MHAILVVLDVKSHLSERRHLKLGVGQLESTLRGSCAFETSFFHNIHISHGDKDDEATKVTDVPHNSDIPIEGRLERR